MCSLYAPVLQFAVVFEPLKEVQASLAAVHNGSVGAGAAPVVVVVPVPVPGAAPVVVVVHDAVAAQVRSVKVVGAMLCCWQPLQVVSVSQVSSPHPAVIPQHHAPTFCSDVLGSEEETKLCQPIYVPSHLDASALATTKAGQFRWSRVV